MRFVVGQPSFEEELAGALAGGCGQRAVLGFVFGHQFTGSLAARRMKGSGMGFFGGGFGEPG